MRSVQYLWCAIRTVQVGVMLCAFFLSLSLEASSSTIALPKKGKEHTPPLSKRIPESVSSLSLFGRIEWKTTMLPWVGEGPYEGISGSGMVAIEGKIYVVGGFIPGGDESGDDVSGRTSRWLWCFDPENSQWTRLPDAPIRREYVRAVAAGNDLFVMGGASQYKGSEPPYRPHNDAASIDLSKKDLVWEMMPALNIARTHMAVGLSNNQLVVAGGNEYKRSEMGYSHLTIRDSVEVFNLEQPEKGWELRAPMPTPARGWAASFSSNDRLYVLGGITWDKENRIIATPETLSYSSEKNVWTKHTPPPISISGWEAALYNDRYAIATGGVVRLNPDSPLIWSDLSFAYDTQNDQWLRIDGELPPGAVFNDPGVVIIGDTIYVLGAEGPYGSHYNYFLIGKIHPAKEKE